MLALFDWLKPLNDEGTEVVTGSGQLIRLRVQDFSDSGVSATNFGKL